MHKSVQLTEAAHSVIWPGYNVPESRHEFRFTPTLQRAVTIFANDARAWAGLEGIIADASQSPDETATVPDVWDRHFATLKLHAFWDLCELLAENADMPIIDCRIIEPVCAKPCMEITQGNWTVTIIPTFAGYDLHRKCPPRFDAKIHSCILT